MSVNSNYILHLSSLSVYSKSTISLSKKVAVDQLSLEIPEWWDTTKYTVLSTMTSILWGHFRHLLYTGISK